MLAIAAERAQLYQRYGINEVTDDLLNQELTLNVNVGLGATDPIMKLQNFMLGIRTVLEVLNNTPPGTLNTGEVAKEVFGRLGYKDGNRFMVGQTEDDPEKAQMVQAIEALQAQNEQLQAAVADKQRDRELKLITTKMKEESEDKRVAAQLETEVEMKHLDLLNPVVGERPSGG